MTTEELYEKYYYKFIDNEKEIKIFEEHGLEFPHYDKFNIYITNSIIRWCINRILDLTKKFVPDIVKEIPDEIINNIKELYKFTEYRIFDTLSCIPNTQLESNDIDVICRPMYYYAYNIFEKSVDIYLKTWD